MTGKGRDKAAFSLGSSVVLTTCLDRGIGAFATRLRVGPWAMCQVDTGQVENGGPLFSSDANRSSEANPVPT